LTQNSPFISIIILNYNGKDFLKPCLDSVLSAQYENLEIIIVDNGSTDESVAYIQENYGSIENLTIIKKGKNFGVPEGRNIGLKQARGEYVIFLDNDTIVDKNWIEGFLEAFNVDERIAVAQAKLLSINEKDRFDHAGDYLTTFGFLQDRADGAKDTGQFDRVENIFNAKGAAIMIKNSVLKEVGTFDSSYFMYLEETDFCWRIWLAGYRVVFAPKAVVWHEPSLDDSERKKASSKFIVRYYGCRNYIITVLKNAGFIWLLRFSFFQIPCFFMLSLLFLLTGKVKDSFYIIRALLSIAKDLPQILKKRNLVQGKIRKLKDSQFFNLILKRQPLGFYARNALRYISGKAY